MSFISISSLILFFYKTCMKETVLLTDGYKIDHRRQYPKGTEYVYSNWTPRSCSYFPEASEGTVVFGIQYMIEEFFIKQFNEGFFNRPKGEVVEEFAHRIKTFLGEEAFKSIGTEHIEKLHDLGYLPIRIKALPEGSLCPIRVPALTFINTDPEFFWLTNYFETLISNTLWLPMTSATSARLYKKELYRHAKKTGYFNDPDVILGFSCHDFSMRGMGGVEATVLSGMGHMTSFIGSESLPAIAALEEYYAADASKEIIGSTVPATEHSVMCAGGFDDEFLTFKRIITEIYPEGFVSIVSDTWDYWNVIENFLPRLKDIIMNRHGRVIIRPDSGCPEDIICGYWTKPDYSTKIIDGKYYYKIDGRGGWKECSKGEYYGTYQMMWDLFGGSVTKAGYKKLDSHIGLIYGDSITLERQKEIYARLESLGFCASNLVLGVGSYTYQYKSRDSLGFAMKATWCQINGEGREIFKKPKTDSGTKNSLKGLIRVIKDDNTYVAYDQCSKDAEEQSELKTVFENGNLVTRTSLQEIRKRVDESILSTFNEDN
jgi:nicotinamide phosphoribosyltransferase